MKITDITAFVTKPPGAFSNYVFVKVGTDEGIVGWGESSIGANSVAAVIEEFGSAIVGRGPRFRIEEPLAGHVSPVPQRSGRRSPDGSDFRHRNRAVGHQGQGAGRAGL